MKSLKFFLVLILPILSGAQTIKGMIYDAETTIKGAKLINSTQNILTYSDGEGLFQIEAKLNDTIVISSYFHFEQKIIVTQDYFDNILWMTISVVSCKFDSDNMDFVEIEH